MCVCVRGGGQKLDPIYKGKENKVKLVKSEICVYYAQFT